MFKNRKKIFASLALGGTFLLGGIAIIPTTFAANVNVQVNVAQESKIDWDQAELIAIGVSPPDDRGTAISREAALMSAQRNLVGIIQGMQIDSETTMRELIIQSDVVNRKITGVLRGAQIVDEWEIEGGGYYIKLRVPLYGFGGIADAIVPIIQDDVAIPFEPAKHSSSGGVHYTGIVIDASGMDLESTFSPVIYDTDGRAIYGIKNLRPNLVIEKGMVSYSDSVESSVTSERAGNNPLIVHAVEVRGGKNSTNKVNAVVSVEDADKILLANEQAKILENCAVVFVK